MEVEELKRAGHEIRLIRGEPLDRISVEPSRETVAVLLDPDDAGLSALVGAAAEAAPFPILVPQAARRDSFRPDSALDECAYYFRPGDDLAAAIACALALHAAGMEARADGPVPPCFVFKAAGDDILFCGMNRAGWLFSEGKLDPMLGRSFGEVWRARPGIFARLAECLETGANFSYQGWHELVSTGERKYLGIRLHYAGPSIAVVSARDLTTEKIRDLERAGPAGADPSRDPAAARLRAMAAALDAMNAALPFGLFRVRAAADGRVALEYASSRACELLGFGPGPGADGPGAVGHGPDRDAAIAEYFRDRAGPVGEALAGRRRVAFDVAARDGRPRRIELYPDADDRGACSGIVAEAPGWAALLERRAGEVVEGILRLAEDFREVAGFYAPARGGPPAPTAAAVAAAGEPLSKREGEVLGLLLRGRSNTAIARELYISESTVKKHVHAVLDKFGVASRRELLACVPAAG